MTGNTIHVINFRPRRYGPQPTEEDYLLLEDGDFLLTEDNDKIILEYE